ncbi:MAG: UbiA family prenyltransferase, partial [Flavobacteriaceae bacterium]|nr:UbiA family prenyltransferase [Bacteroidia bacterium]NNL60728.1 UbiA family prenyltransferase [Flavobacteriaceae bacterium]
TAVLNLNNMRDIDSDKKSGKRTVAVKFGRAKAKHYHYFLVITAMLVSLLFSILYFRSYSNLIFFVIFIPLILHVNRVKNNTEPVLLDPELKKLALSTVFLALFLGLGYIL